MSMTLKEIVKHHAEFTAYAKMLRVVGDVVDHVRPALLRLIEAAKREVDAATDPAFKEFAQAVLVMVEVPTQTMDALLLPILGSKDWLTEELKVAAANYVEKKDSTPASDSRNTTPAPRQDSQLTNAVPAVKKNTSGGEFPDADSFSVAAEQGSDPAVPRTTGEPNG